MMTIALVASLSLTARAQQHQAATPTATTTTSAPATSATPATPAAATPVASNDGHEYAPLLEKTINYKDWQFKSLTDNAPVDLREWAKGKKLVMVVYFAPWCGNWRAEAPVVARLYDKYKSQGFDVVAVSEYGTQDAVRAFFTESGAKGAPYSVVTESEGRDARDKTTHYALRQSCGDTRRWGSPFNVFLEPSKLNKSGDVLTEKAWVVGGELIEKDAEGFIREKLGLSEQSAVEPCENKTGDLKLSENKSIIKP